VGWRRSVARRRVNNRSVARQQLKENHAIDARRHNDLGVGQINVDNYSAAVELLIKRFDCAHKIP